MSAIIFDLDGTIADTLEFFQDFLVSEAKLEPLTMAEKKALHGLTLLGIARKLGHPWWRLARLYFEGRTKLNPVIDHYKPLTGMPDVIRKLHSEGHELFIISSNSVPNVRDFLKLYKLDSRFVDLRGGAVLFGKRPALRRLISKHRLELRNSVYVGDEVRDIEGAKAVNMRVVAVTWGFAKSADLQAAKPTKIVDSPEELLNYLQNI